MARAVAGDAHGHHPANGVSLERIWTWLALLHWRISEESSPFRDVHQSGATSKLVRERYADFGLTLAHEKLLEHHGLAVGLTTVRKWMIADGVWTTRRERTKRMQQPRYRRACLGELVQIDGSDHEWF